MIAKLNRGHEEAITRLTTTALVNTHLDILIELLGDSSLLFPNTKALADSLRNVFISESASIIEECIEHD